MFLSALTILFSATNTLIFQKSFQTTLKTWVLLQQTPFNKKQTFSLNNTQTSNGDGYCGWKNVLSLQHPLCG